MTYIHYGSDHFDPALFVPVRNGGLEYGFRPKPADGTGLWASREGDPDGWEAWCRGARFHLDALNQSFRFTMPGATGFTKCQVEKALNELKPKGKVRREGLDRGSPYQPWRP